MLRAFTNLFFFRTRGSSRWRCRKTRRMYESACSRASRRYRRRVQTNCPSTAAGCVDFAAVFVRLLLLCETISAVVIFLAQWSRQLQTKSTVAIIVQPNLKLTACSLITRTNVLRTHSFSRRRKMTQVAQPKSNMQYCCIVNSNLE